MKKAYFITGTDTNIGKTWATITLLRKFKQLGLIVAGMKPVASGCDWQSDTWVNQDALLIQQNSNPGFTYQQINPYAFSLPISPHLAAGDTHVELNRIISAYKNLLLQVDLLLVEGAGGWLSPLSNELDNAGLAHALQLQIILVVGMRLGCLNHARLTFQSIQASGLTCAGWIAMEIEPNMSCLQENISYIQRSIGAPLIGLLPYTPQADFDILRSHLVSVESLI